MYIYIDINIYLYIYIYIYVCIYVCIYIYIHICISICLFIFERFQVYASRTPFMFTSFYSNLKALIISCVSHSIFLSLLNNVVKDEH